MNTPHEPLTPEERALARQLSKLGPHGGPSPQLDARILAAARAAVDGDSVAAPAAPRTRRRWPLGMGVAASVLLAAGVAWQLRPTHEIPIASEVPMQAAEESADAAAAAEPVMTPSQNAVPAPPPPPPAEVAEPRPADAPPVATPARRNAEAAARQESPPKRSPIALIPAVPGLSSPAEEARKAAPAAFPPVDAETVDAAPRMMAPPAAPPAPAADAVAERKRLEAREQAQERAESYGFAGERQRAEAEAADSRSLDSVVVTRSRVAPRSLRNATAVPSTPTTTAAPPPPPPAPAASAGSSAQPSAARSTLRRTDLQVPVDEDARLPPGEWLDRIRLRRDLGDSANALRSLQLFVQEHPFQRIPDDLRPLLGEP